MKQYRDSHEMTLMLIESVLNFDLLPPILYHSCNLIMQQTNFNLMQIECTLDQSSIQIDKFVPNQNLFTAQEPFEFVMKLFDHQIQFQQIQLNLETVAHLAHPQDLHNKRIGIGMATNYASLPEKLIGDEMRLKQVLVSLTRHTISLHSNAETKIQVAFKREAQLLIVHLTMPSIALKCKGNDGLSELIKMVQQSDSDHEIFNCFTDELRVSLYISKSIVEFSGGSLNLVFDESSQGIKIIFSMSMREPDAPKLEQNQFIRDTQSSNFTFQKNSQSKYSKISRFIASLKGSSESSSKKRKIPSIGYINKPKKI